MSENSISQHQVFRLGCDVIQISDSTQQQVLTLHYIIILEYH